MFSQEFDDEISSQSEVVRKVKNSSNIAEKSLNFPSTFREL